MNPSSRGPAAEPLPVWLLSVLGFFSGSAVMIVEFAGNRLLSPGFGNSLYTWTGLIGVILVALSCGDFFGGWLVDRHPHFSLLPLIFGLGGLLTAAVPGLLKLCPPFEQLDLVKGPVFISLALFFLPGLVLATVTPVSIRLLSRAKSDEHIGQAAGTVGMAAALGSFAGTLATSYFLIPRFGVRQIFVVLGAGLCVLAIVLVLINARTRSRPAKLLVLALAGFGTAAWSSITPPVPEDVLFTKDTFYHRITVKESGRGTSNAVRYLQLDSTMEGAQVVSTGELVFPYQQYWHLAEVLCEDVKKAAFLGAGAFGMPEQLSLRYPQARVRVVEIDPDVIEVGRKFFRLDEFPRVEAVAADARRYLRTSGNGYDFIFGDAYNGVQFVPPHLVTREFFGEVRDRLNPGGVFVMNLIGSTQGDHAELFWTVVNSVRKEFADVVLFGTSSHNPAESQNLIIVASAEPIEPRIAAWQQAHGSAPSAITRLLESRIDLGAAPEGTSVFTDDHNPVEFTVARQLRPRR